MPKGKLAIFGPYPPPLGGISVHIERISKYLQINQLDFTIFNYGYFNGENIIATKKSPWFYLKFIFEKRFKFIHFHNNISLEFLYYFVFSILNKTPLLITIHAESILHVSSFQKKFFLFFIRHTQSVKFISVSENIYNLLKKENLDVLFLPAYVPPTSVHLKETLPDSRNKFLFSVWRLTETEAKNVYNVPLAFEFLRQNKSQFKMIFMIGSKSASDLNYLKKLISDYDLSEDIEIVFDQNIVDYIQNCKFILRTNIADAYGISLQEAMDLGVPAIGSNVCLRPEGTVLFENNDLMDLTRKINEVVSKDKIEFLKNKKELNYHLDLINLYKGYLSI